MSSKLRQAEASHAGSPVAPRSRECGAAVAAGLLWSVLAFLSLPPVSLWWIGLVAPLPVAVVAWRTSRPMLAAFGVGLGTLPLWGYHHAWIAEVSLAGVVPLVAYLGLWPALVVVVLARLRHLGMVGGPAVIVPTAWVALEYTRGELAFGGYAWFLAGHPMVEFPTIARGAAFGGVYFVSWVVVALSGIVVARRVGSATHRRIALGVSAGLIGLLGASALVPRGGEPGRPIRVAALQTNVPQSNKVFPTQEQLVEDFRSLIALADEAVRAEAELLVTPETVLPGGMLDPAGRAVVDEPFGGALLTEQRRLGVPMLVGCITLDGIRFDGDRAIWDDTFNSVYLLAEGRVRGPRYDKLRPTPFGETLPYIQSLPWLRDLVLRIGLGASGMDFGLTPGGEAVSFAVPMQGREVTVTTPICFESSMAPTVRGLVNAARASGRPTELLCVVTNDGWFGRFDPGREMHLLQARWRCVEHRLPMIRCANTGVSAVIDREGRVTAALAPRSEGVLVGAIAPGGTVTIYQRVGDSFGAACAGFTLVGLLVTFVRRPKGAPSAEPAVPPVSGQGDDA